MDPPFVFSRNVMRTIVLLLCVVVASCSGDSTPGSPTPAAGTPVTPAAFTLLGDPESAQGATWTYRGTIGGVAFDLQGILLKPRGAGPFPAVVISHGSGGSAVAYSRGVGVDMVQWGLVCIATNYTHAAGVPLGAPGSAGETGASQPNILRAHAAYELLRQLGYVDMTRVAAHGHSMGGFVTAAVAGAYPADFRALSHTAGGARPDGAPGFAPTDTQVRSIRAPYQMHHGDRDTVVSLALDQRLDSLLQGIGVTRELLVYPGADHDDVARDPVVLGRVRAWYTTHGVLR
jgi:dienelactone hydrolase